MFLISGPSSVLRAFEWLANAACVLLQNVICLCSLSMAGKWQLFDKLFDRESLYPSSIFSRYNQHIVDLCKGGVSVDFCDSTASAQGDDGYLFFFGLYVVRPIGSPFNFKTPSNPNADIDISDPLNAGYFERVTTWWGNYEDWEEQPALSFFTYIPLLLLLVLLPLLQFVLSLMVAAFHFVSMILQLILLPVLVASDYDFIQALSRRSAIS
jgi:hypothetical protein